MSDYAWRAQALETSVRIRASAILLRFLRKLRLQKGGACKPASPDDSWVRRYGVSILGGHFGGSEIGNGAEDSWNLRLDWQAEEVCRQVKQIPLFADGFNLVGLSQGALIGRAYIQWCDGGPAVHNLISLGGPHAGVASTPRCGVSRFLPRPLTS